METLLKRLGILCFVLFAFSGCNNVVKEKDSIKIGANLSLTGKTAYWSEQIKKGLDLALDDVNKDQKKRNITIIYDDNQAKTNLAVSAFQKEATIDNVSVVITCFTPIAKPLRESAKQFGIPLVATVTSAFDFGLANEWSFRDFPPQDQQANTMADYSFNILKLRNISSIVVNDDYGLDGYKAFKEHFEKLGGVVNPYETAEQTDLDFRTQVIKAITSKPDGVFLIIRDNALGTMVKQIREYGYKGVILGVNAFDSPLVWDACKESGEGAIFTSGYVNFKENENAEKFEKEYISKYNEEPNFVSVYGYSIGMYLSEILRQTNGDRNEIKRALSNLNVQSIRGKILMNPKREVISPIGIYIRKGIKNELIEKIENF